MIPILLPFVFGETPPPPLKLNLNGNYPYYLNYCLFEAESVWELPSLPQLPSVLKETPSPLCVILCARYTIWVSILIKSIVLSLFLTFITLSDLYYPHHPPSDGFTFRSRKKAFYTYCRYVAPSSIFREA